VTAKEGLNLYVTVIVRGENNTLSHIFRFFSHLKYVCTGLLPALTLFFRNALA